MTLNVANTFEAHSRDLLTGATPLQPMPISIGPTRHCSLSTGAACERYAMSSIIDLRRTEQPR
jgi:hypothetical protein